MIKNTFVGELVFGLIFVILLLLLLNPFPMYMPGGLEMALIVGAVLVFTIFGALVWREGAADEREMAHRSLAGRAGFLAGTVVLTIGVLVQSLEHRVDPWLVVGLGVMVLAKLVGLIYGKYHR